VLINLIREGNCLIEIFYFIFLLYAYDVKRTSSSLIVQHHACKRMGESSLEGPTLP
jgi:hypothetical protein